MTFLREGLLSVILLLVCVYIFSDALLIDEEKVITINTIRKATSTSGAIIEKPVIEKRRRLDKRVIRMHDHSFALISRGCSGSSTAITFTTDILEAHGVSVVKGLREILKPKANKFWDSALQNLQRSGDISPGPSGKYPYQDVILEAMNQSILSAKKNNETLVFKIGPNFLNGRKSTGSWGGGGTDKLANGLKEMGVVFLPQWYRSNALDRAVCAVRDCFTKGKLGYPVFANGTRTDDLCKKRRKLDVKVKAYFADTSLLVKRLQHEEQSLSEETEFLSTLTKSESFPAEDMYAFEYTQDKDVFVQSRHAWIKFLSSAIDADKTTVTGYLKKYQGLLTLKPHSDVIDNIDDLTIALKNANPPLDHYLRY